ncbi:MAG: hypothetical protein HY423_00010 [Candidatus Lambdaproteobacteria bacterium]|nr:hypothetical protein [Candidatus Lambdaproteobacteria bacterium]
MIRNAGSLKVVAAALICAVWAATSAQAQVVREKPTMENVFFNVVWGSAAGALLGAAGAVVGSEDKTKPSNLRSSMFEGATAGGVIGISAGIWLVYAGITFEPGQSTVVGAAGFALNDAAEPVGPAALQGMGGGLAAAPRPGLPPVAFEWSSAGPLRLTGFRVTALDLRF